MSDLRRTWQSLQGLQWLTPWISSDSPGGKTKSRAVSAAAVVVVGIVVGAGEATLPG